MPWLCVVIIAILVWQFMNNYVCSPLNFFIYIFCLANTYGIDSVLLHQDTEFEGEQRDSVFVE